VTIAATGAVAIDHAITATKLTLTGQDVAFGIDFNGAPSMTDVTTTNGDIDAAGHQLRGFHFVSITNGDLLAGGLSANTLTMNGSGNIDVTNDLVLAHPLVVPGTVNVGGLLSVQSISGANITTGALDSNSVTSSGVLPEKDRKPH
jgi:hypothetical protein